MVIFSLGVSAGPRVGLPELAIHLDLASKLTVVTNSYEERENKIKYLFLYDFNAHFGCVSPVSIKQL